MKLLSKALIACLVVANFGCGDDEGPAYEFKDQNLQGQINGKSWTFVDGNAEVNSFDDTRLSIELGAEALEDPCDFFSISGLRVFFSVKNEVTLTELNFSLDDEGGQTITLFDPEGNQNIIATAGAIEILTITATEITGKMDARYEGDGGDGVNGNFSVTFCSE